MRVKYILFFFMTISFVGCNHENEMEDVTAVFEMYNTDTIIIGNMCYNLKELAYNIQFNALYDQTEHKLWIHSIIDGKSHFKFLQKDGDLSESIIVSYEYLNPLLGGCPLVNDNIVLIGASGNLKHICVNLNDGDYFVIELNSDNFLFKHFVGFSGEFIFGEDWSYDLKLNNKHMFPVKLSYPSYMADIDRIVGIDGDGNTVALNYRTDEYETLPIKKRKLLPERFFYSPESLYYVNKDYVYYSEYSKWYPAVFYFTYFFKASEPRKWYRYNKNTRETVRIKAPNEFSSILGVTE